MTPLQKIQAARYALVAQRPYLATALMRLRIVESQKCPHPLAASENWVVYCNPDLVAEAQMPDLVVHLRREVERLIRRHARRLRAYPREIAEVASTLEVDDDLAAEYGERTEWTLPQTLGFDAGRMAEEYAMRLMDVLADEGAPKSAQQQDDSQSGDESDSGAGAGQQGDAPSSDAAASSASSDSSRAGSNSSDASSDSSGATSACSQASDASGGSPTASSDSSGRAAGAGACDSSGAGAGDSAGSSTGDSADASAGDAASGPSGGASSEPRAPAPQSGSAATGRHAPWESGEESVSEVEIDRLVEETVRRAQEWHKTRGSAPANLLRRYEEMVKTAPVPWQRLLARAINDARVYASGANDYTYRRPSRRQHAVRDVVMPAMQRPLLEVAVVVDTSDSISDDELGIALHEVQTILKRGGVANLRVYFANTRIVHEALVRTPAEAVRIFRQLRGGGGTDMGVAVREAMLKRPRPHAVVVITDGVTPWGDAPQCRVPVIALITPRGRKGQTPDWIKEVPIDESV